MRRSVVFARASRASSPTTTASSSSSSSIGRVGARRARVVRSRASATIPRARRVDGADVDDELARAKEALESAEAAESESAAGRGFENLDREELGGALSANDGVAAPGIPSAVMREARPTVMPTKVPRWCAPFVDAYFVDHSAQARAVPRERGDNGTRARRINSTRPSRG